MQRFTARPFFRPDGERLRYLPESPRQLRNLPGRDSVVGWVNIQEAKDLPTGSLNLLDLATGKNTNFPLPGRPGFFAETERPGVVLVAMERRLVLFDLTTGQLTETGVTLTSDERVIANDGLAIPGGLLVGTKHLEFRDRIAALYFVDAARKQVGVLLDREVCSNGKYWIGGSEGSTLIEIDSQPRTITRYRVDAQMRVRGSSLVSAPDALPAVPDGLRPAPGAESVVVAFYNPGAVATGLAQEIRLSDGAVLTEWGVPGSPRVTCPELVWLDGRVQLILTTATEGMPPEVRAVAPEAGTIFIADTPFDAMPEAPPLLRW